MFRFGQCLEVVIHPCGQSAPTYAHLNFCFDRIQPFQATGLAFWESHGERKYCCYFPFVSYDSYEDSTLNHFLQSSNRTNDPKEELFGLYEEFTRRHNPEFDSLS
jgi:hypothetical protein